MPTISIVIPVYNAESFIRRCLDSIVSQCYSDFEVLLIDDGSSDSSASICDLYASKYDYFSVIHTPNRGVSAARNLGIKSAKGSFVTFIDADDYVSPRHLQAFVDAGALDSDLCLTGVNAVYNDRSLYHTTQIKDTGTKISRNTFIEDCITSGHCLSPWAKLFRQSFLKSHDIKFDEQLKYAEDRVFIAQVLTSAKTFSASDECTYIYTHENPIALTLHPRPHAQIWPYIKQYYPLIEHLLSEINANEKLRNTAHQLYSYEALAMVSDLISDSHIDFHTRKAKLKQIPYELRKILRDTPLMSKGYKLLAYALYYLPAALCIRVARLFP